MPRSPPSARRRLETELESVRNGISEARERLRQSFGIDMMIFGHWSHERDPQGVFRHNRRNDYAYIICNRGRSLSAVISTPASRSLASALANATRPAPSME